MTFSFFLFVLLTALINQFSKQVFSLEQKLTAQNIQNFGTKAMITAHVIGKKVSNILHKIENVRNALMPIDKQLQQWQDLAHK